MTNPGIVKPDEESRRTAKAKTTSNKNAYRRLAQNPDFHIFYTHLEMCYNSYMEAGAESSTPKDVKDHLLAEAASIHKILSYLKRQTT